MKNLITLMIVVFCISNITVLNAQETIIPLKDGDLSNIPLTGDIYHKDTTNTFDKFMETWVFDNGTNYFKVTFSKKERVRYGNMRVYSDELVCEYLFKVNGITIYDTYGVNSNINNLGANHISGDDIINENKIKLMYGEPPVNSCHKYAKGKLTLNYISGATPTLQWTRVNDELYGDNSTCPDGSSMDLTDFVIPANMILVKQ
ncbi:DUF6705 family protein [uncultured Lacinutrix sp.]|uniref:DUF6705 family protein n=1 Tax=uncultured Lacinutrix sp. TaxID=574032 RepID=UPI002639DA06|nr:DUF6705 family protein [uncultured Lacinutrix sp.]